MTPEQWQRAKALLGMGVGPSSFEQEQAVRAMFPEAPEIWEDVLRLVRVATGVVEVHSTTVAPVVTSRTTLLADGAICGPYRVVRMLGQGGMSQVFLAVDVRTEQPGMRVRQVALKCLAGHWLESPDARQRLLMEFANWASIGTHSHIGTPYDALDVSDPPMLVLVLEYLEGTTLQALIARGALPWRFALTLASQIAEGVGHAHDAGILHCDIKAANVIVSRSNQAKVLDFGLSRVLHGPGHGDDRVGTLAYMAPDRIVDNVLDKSGDLYSLGVTLYEMLTGRRPFRAPDDLQLIAEILETEPPPPSTLVSRLPAGIDPIVARALAKVPRQRFQSARELNAALRSVLQRTPLTWAQRAARAAAAGVVVLSVLYFLGVIGSLTVDAGLGRSGGFLPDLQRPTVVWGAMSLTAPVAVLLSVLLPLSALAIVLRLVYRNVRLLRRHVEPFVVDVMARLRNIAAPPTEVFSQAMLLLQIAVLAAFVWAFFPYIMAVAHFVNPLALPGSLEALRPGNDPLHESYLVWKTMMLFALAASSYAVIRCRQSNGERLNVATIGGLLTILFGLFLFALPFQVVYHAESERAVYASDVCYIVARNGAGQARLFCPMASAPRVRTVRLDDARLVHTGIVESVFAEFDRQRAAGEVTR